MLALIVSLVFAIAASGHDAGQLPTSRWKKASPFPEPDEERYGAALNGDVWEYDPAADSWKSLGPMPTKRGAAVAVEVGGKIYVIGGATTVAGSKAPYFTFFGPSLVLTTNEVFDPATNKWESRRPMSV